MSKTKEKNYTIEEYLTIAEEADHKVEYHWGQLYDMAGGTPNHNIISGNLITNLNNALHHSNCRVFNSDQQIAIQASQSYYYPDAAVTCGDSQFDETGLRLINPVLVIEVLSKSTKGFDKTKKFSFYRLIPSFKEYILIDSDSISFEGYFRKEKDLWCISSGFKLEDKINLYSLGIELSLEEIYFKTLGLF